MTMHARERLTDTLFAETDDIIRRWAATQLAAWQHIELRREEAESRLRAAALRDGSICLIRIDNGRVSLDPEIVSVSPHMTQPFTPMGDRARYYLAHLQSAFTTFGMTGSGLIGIYLNDIYPDGMDVPLFCFQKRHGSRGMLLPDIDFLSWRYYYDEQNRYLDHTSFLEKADEAIFVGSTTGDIILTAAHVDTLSNARLRAAVHFRDRERVTFHLPQIVQCDGADTEARVRALDVSGRRWTWQEQLGFRYLLSLDGNGATCSRVALALASNAALIKYESPYQLYYFQGLEPWTHYIPVLTDGEVEELIEQSWRLTDTGERIARSSREFAVRFLSRSSVLRYAAELVALYLAKMGEPSQPLAPRNATHLIEVYGHVAERGSVWAAPAAWLSEGYAQTPLEGVCLMPSEHIPPEDLRYATIDANGSIATAMGGAFCGSHGIGQSLFGFGATLAGASAKRFRLSYALRFADGFQSVAADRLNPTPRGSPITDIRITVHERWTAPWRRTHKLGVSAAS